VRAQLRGAEVSEGRSAWERERAAADDVAQQLQLTRANKQAADGVLLECWLNDVLMARPAHPGAVDFGQVRRCLSDGSCFTDDGLRVSHLPQPRLVLHAGALDPKAAPLTRIVWVI
jgi:hypothetical protein